MVYRYLALNVVFLVFCIPVITIPAALAGLFSVSRKFVYSEDPSIFRTFLDGFKENFRQSLAFGLFLLIAGALLWFDYSLARTYDSGLLMCIWAIALFASISLTVHLCSLLVHMELSVKDLFSNALKISLIKPFVTVFIIVVILAFSYVSFIVPILFFTFFFSVSATITYRLINIKFAVIGVSKSGSDSDSDS